MQIETRKVRDVLVVNVSGRLDSRTVGDAGDRMTQIAQGGDRSIVLNVEKLDYLTSAGLRAILLAAKLLQTNHGTMTICGASGVVKQAFEAAGFDALLKTFDTERDAVAALST